MSKSDKMTNLVSYPFLSEKDADQQLVEKDFLMKRSIRTFGKECSWPNVSSDLPLSISLLLSHFHFTILLYTNYLSFFLSLSPSLSCIHSLNLIHTQSYTLAHTHYISLYLIHTLSYTLSHTHSILLSVSYTLSLSLYHTQSILHSVSYTLYLTLWLIHTVFLSISYTHYLTLAQ